MISNSTIKAQYNAGTGDMIIPVIIENLLMTNSKHHKHFYINVFKCCDVEEKMFEVC